MFRLHCIKSTQCAIFIIHFFHIHTIIITEVRQEAVQQALAALKNRPKPSLPMPSKRSSVLNRSPDRDRDDSGKLLSPFLNRKCVSYKQTNQMK